MSLINKMLQDLDARGSHAGSATEGEIRPVMIAERRLPVIQIAGAATLLIVAMGTGAYFWLKSRVPAAPPARVAAPVVVAAPPETVIVVAKQVPYVPPAPAPVVLAAGPATSPVQAAPPAAAPKIAARAARDPLSQPDPAPAPMVRKQASVVRVIESDRLHDALVAAPRTAGAAAPLHAGRDMNNSQRAESFYRQSLAALDDGRVAAAIDGMEQALKLNPRHDAARQSLVGLLIEAGRKDEAMQQLEQGLAADPAQAQLAMLLARMQIERGTSGVATLQRTLPAAQNNGEYRAFLAGALQREQRHREAAEQYAAALRLSPEQGVWLMGMGISLQADKRDAEALAAFQRAKMSGMLTPALMSFVQGRIGQLQGQ